jgi:hypothetical protein
MLFGSFRTRPQVAPCIPPTRCGRVRVDRWFGSPSMRPHACPLGRRAAAMTLTVKLLNDSQTRFGANKRSILK